jgi:tRNA1(Val) A37 N6-methylase TrmN6
LGAGFGRIAAVLSAETNYAKIQAMESQEKQTATTINKESF